MSDTIHGPITKPYADTVSKTWNDPESSIFAHGKFGECYFGDDSAGIFQRIITSKGKKSRKLRFYVPTYRDTYPLHQNRLKMKYAVYDWHIITDEQKEQYNQMAKGTGMSGFNLWCKIYLKGTIYVS